MNLEGALKLCKMSVESLDLFATLVFLSSWQTILIKAGFFKKSVSKC